MSLLIGMEHCTYGIAFWFRDRSAWRWRWVVFSCMHAEGNQQEMETTLFILYS